jgi:hypothetical protein
MFSGRLPSAFCALLYHFWRHSMAVRGEARLLERLPECLSTTLRFSGVILYAKARKQTARMDTAYGPVRFRILAISCDCPGWRMSRALIVECSEGLYCWLGNVRLGFCPNCRLFNRNPNIRPKLRNGDSGIGTRGDCRLCPFDRNSKSTVLRHNRTQT